VTQLINQPIRPKRYVWPDFSASPL